MNADNSKNMNRLKRTTLIAAALIGLAAPGCTSYVHRAVDRAAEVSDDALNAAEFTICRGASIGSIRRHYGEPSRARIWAALCNSTDAFSPEQ